MFADNMQVEGIHTGPFTGGYTDGNTVRRKRDRSIVKPEILYCPHKLYEVWDGKYELIEEDDLELLEKWSRDPRKKRFQVSISTFESKPAKAGECDMCDAR